MAINTHLKPSHVPWIAGILQAVLVALEEEFKEKSETENGKMEKCKQSGDTTVVVKLYELKQARRAASASAHGR